MASESAKLKGLAAIKHNTSFAMHMGFNKYIGLEHYSV
jgi:hypothetical protein